MEVHAQLNAHGAMSDGRVVFDPFMVVSDLLPVVCWTGKSGRAHEMLCCIKRHRRADDINDFQGEHTRNAALLVAGAS